MFTYEPKGICVTNSDFWIDAHRKVDFSFISHGHSDHLRNHNNILATPATLRFHDIRGKQRQVTPLEFGETFKVDDLTIQLFPAGHILGSAMIRVERDGTSLLYTGDFKMKPSWTAEPIEIPQADIVIMESTFGSPEFVFNQTKENLLEQLDEFIEGCFARKITPIVLAYNLGKSQEAMKMLGDHGYSVKVNKKAWELAQVYKDFGVEFKYCSLWNEEDLKPGEVLIMPPHLANSRQMLSMSNTRTVLLSGWANGNGGFRYRYDTAIPLSDHADFNDLIQFVKIANPKKVYTTHGFHNFPIHLRAIGFDAHVLEHTKQQTLL
jgi:Cft2 family RNA processing exonuclease